MIGKPYAGELGGLTQTIDISSGRAQNMRQAKGVQYSACIPASGLAVLNQFLYFFGTVAQLSDSRGRLLIALNQGPESAFEDGAERLPSFLALIQLCPRPVAAALRLNLYRNEALRFKGLTDRSKLFGVAGTCKIKNALPGRLVEVGGAIFYAVINYSYSPLSVWRPAKIVAALAKSRSKFGSKQYHNR